MQRESLCLLASDFAKHETHLRGQIMRGVCVGSGQVVMASRSQPKSHGGDCFQHRPSGPRPRCLVTELPEGLLIRQPLLKGQLWCNPKDGVTARPYYCFRLEAKLFPK